MESANDFTIVFDLVCDIEVHLDKGFEFYQIKTHKESQPKYTAKSLVKVKEGEQVSSFKGANDAIGTLVLKVDSENELKSVLTRPEDYLKVIVK